MASLMKKLCDTMPLAGVMGALQGATPGGASAATIGRLSRHLRYHPTLNAMQVSCPRPGRVTTKGGEPIWGYDVPADPTRIKQITCRVRDDSYNNYLVLEELEWGFAPRDNPSDFRPAVQVAVDAQTVVELPLIEAARLLTLTTKGGQNQEDLHRLWPLKAVHDPSILHVFVYDLTIGAGKIEPLKSPDHRDALKVRRLLQTLEEVNQADPEDDLQLKDFLFDDDLWDEDPTTAAPSGTVPENVNLSFTPIRVVVAVSLTVCRERDDYQPGRPMGVGRIYPHVMVVANADLLRVDAGVRFKRPREMTLLDAMACGCGEMLSEIGSILITDSNANAMMFPNEALGNPPLPVWANLFNYYVPDPFLDPSLAGKLIPLVSPLKSTSRDTQGFVERDCTDLPVSLTNGKRLTKVERQGQFDNIHLAPKMTVKTLIDWISVDGTAIPFENAAEWKMDKVTMAPFCAHDCFHLHWRWTDNGNTERATFGWGPTSPYKIVGAPMVPRNQRVDLYLISARAISYLAQAQGARQNEWQPFCHHGGGYALSAGPLVGLARVAVPLADRLTFWRNDPLGGKTLQAVKSLDWALFYWRLRYTIRKTETVGPNGTETSFSLVERFSFKDKAAALKL